MAENENISGLLCLKVLYSQVRRSVNFAALVTDEVRQKYAVDPFDVLMQLSREQQLRPEQVSTLDDAVKNYIGPMIAECGAGFVLLPNCRQ